MIHLLFELVVYVFLELFGHIFVRLVLCVVVSVFVAVAICCFIPDKALRVSIIALAVVLGLIFGALWELLALKNNKTGDNRR